MLNMYQLSDIQSYCIDLNEHNTSFRQMIGKD